MDFNNKTNNGEIRITMSSVTIIERYGMPTHMDQMPYGTGCKVIDHNHNEYDLYLQVGHDQEKPNWELIERFSNRSHENALQDTINHRLRKNFSND